MSNYSITLKPVYSCPAGDVPEEIELPQNWTLSWHQLETYRAISNPKIDVIFHTGMTGDGKSLAAYLHTLQGQNEAHREADPCGIALYPTNELARDQERQIQNYIEEFKPVNEPRIGRLSSADLEIYAENEGLKKSAAIESRANQREILVTNPDILHYLHRGAYIIPKYERPDKLWGKIDKDFNLFIFDEFHVFSAPQISGVINTMLLIRRTNRKKKFLFLSATPNTEFIDRLKIAGFRVKHIDPTAENKYRFPDTITEAEQLESENWRQIVRTIKLDFVDLESNSSASERWLKDNSSQIVDRLSGGSKGAIVLNSIASVKRLVPFFREILARSGLTVGENTGLSGKEEKERSLQTDLVLGTSTIDVGVDFKINFLIFESADAGNFVQRLGRLGRHDGYYKDRNFVKFENFNAIALVPKFFVGRLFEEDSAPLKVNEVYDRVFFHAKIRENYRKINDFRYYYSKWGAVQSVRLCYQLSDRTIRNVYPESQQAFKQDCQQVFNTSLGSVARRIKEWRQEWQELSGKDKGNPIAQEAASFRGSSSLLCGLYDTTELNEADRFKTYSLPGILSNLEIETITEKEFRRLLKDTVDRINYPIPKSRFNYCLKFMKLRRYREEKSNWRFTYPGDLKEIGDRWKVQVLVGIEVWQPENFWISKVNKKLKKQGLVCYVLPFPLAEVRMRLRLPMHFQIYPICDRNSLLDATAPYSIAFQQSSLLIDTLANCLKSTGKEIWVA